MSPYLGVIEDDKQIPEVYSLSQNYPNPFNPYSTISFGLPEQAYIRLTIYDILGRKVRTLMDKRLEPGYHEIVWNGKDNHGNNVSSGMYLYAIQAGHFISVRKMVLLR
ncbi:MAG: T9SS type A sorting domain-containing protein [Candidatus Marinimicrobia bacterium]|nr:T9SS type A sorting domain-containing protein [Candidatus Neomarinimicrobiota bacterium]